MKEKKKVLNISYKFILLFVAFLALLLHISYGEILGAWQNLFLVILLVILTFLVIYPSIKKWGRDQFLLYFILAFGGIYFITLLHYLIIHYHLLLGQPLLKALIFYCFDFSVLFLSVLLVVSFFKLYYSGAKFRRKFLFFIILFLFIIALLSNSFFPLAIFAFFHSLILPWMRDTAHNLRKKLWLFFAVFWITFFWLPKSIFFRPNVQGLQPLILGSDFYRTLIKLFFIYIILITIRMGISLVETSRGIRSKSVLSYVFTGLIPIVILLGVLSINFISQALSYKYYLLYRENFKRLEDYSQNALKSTELQNTLKELNSYINKTTPLSNFCQQNLIGLQLDFPAAFQTLQVRPAKGGGNYTLGYSSETPDIFKKAAPLPNWFDEANIVDFYKEKGENFIKAIGHNTIDDWQAILQVYIPINENLIAQIESKFNVSIDLAEKGQEYTIGQIIRTGKILGIDITDWQSGSKNHFADLRFYNSWKDIFGLSINEDVAEGIFSSPQIIPTIVAIISITIAFSVILVSTFIGWRINKGMRRSLDALVKGMKRIGEGDLDSKIHLKSFDEYYRLANSINAMTDDLRRNINETIEKQKMEQELKTATLIQQSMLPEDDPMIKGYEISSYARPAKQMGGDYYDYIQLSDKRLGVVVGDVSGHGVPAGLLMAMTKSSLYSQIKTSYKVPDVLFAMNNMVHEVLGKKLLMTFCYSILNLDKRKLSFSSAGHHFPYLFSSKNQELISLESIAYPLGVRKDVRYKEKSVHLMPGDMLLFYTDGIIESRNQTEEEFGFDRLEDLLRKNWHLPAKDIKENIIETIDNFTGENPQFDDITLIVIKVQE